MKEHEQTLQPAPETNPFHLFKSFKCYFYIKRDDFENLEELVSLESQVKALRLQDQLGKKLS